MVLTDAELKEWLKPVQDPELHMSLVDLGLIYTCLHGDSGEAKVQMTLTSPGCPAGDYLVNAVKTRLTEHAEVKAADVQIVWDPKWDPQTMASEECKETLGLW